MGLSLACAPFYSTLQKVERCLSHPCSSLLLSAVMYNGCVCQAGEIARSSGRMVQAAFERTREVNERYQLTGRVSVGLSSLQLLSSLYFLSLCLRLSVSMPVSVYLSLCLCFCQCVCLYVSLSVSLSLSLCISSVAVVCLLSVLTCFSLLGLAHSLSLPVSVCRDSNQFVLHVCALRL